MDGEAPELNPGWVRRRINSCLEVRHALHKRAKPRSKASNRLYACRTALVLFFPHETSCLDSGAAPSMATLATAPARYSLNRCVAGQSVARRRKEQLGMQNILLAVAVAVAVAVVLDLDLDLALAFMMRAAIVPTIQMINEYFGVAVVSEPWMA